MPIAVEPSPEIAYRHDFPILCNARGYKDAVEIGTDQGVFARQFLTRFAGHWLYLVDPYEPYEDFPYDRSGDLLTAVAALTPFHGRFRFVRMKSTDAISVVTKLISPEFIYIDGHHDESHVAADIAAWWPVLPDHGMLAGHDYDETHPGVMAAVDAFATRQRRVVLLTHADPFPSWYIYKTEPATLMIRHFHESEQPNPHARPKQ